MAQSFSAPPRGRRPRHLLRPAVAGLVLLALALAACTGKNNQRNTPPPAPSAASASAPASASATAPATSAATSPSVTGPAGTASTAAASAGTSTPTAADQAIMTVIEKANAEQQQALAQRDPTIMRDSATPEYYRELVQTLRDLLNGGVTAIKLLNLQWGPINVQGTNAQATTFETWQTSIAGGGTEQSTDRNVYALVEQGGTWLIAADAHPDTRLDQPGQGSGIGPGVSVPTAPPSAPGTAQSRNWAGYIATGATGAGGANGSTAGAFTAVSASWTVPQVNANGGGGADATWVGIGGVVSHDLIQAGTDATVLGPGQVQYNAWVELLPQPSQTVPLTVNAGDVIAVSITQQGNGTWEISINDQTTGQRYQTTAQYTSSLSSAEWIEEAPAAATAGLRIVTLDDFGQVQVKNGMTVMGGKEMTIAQAGGQPTTMYGRGGQPIAVPSALGQDGSSFTVTRASGGSPVIGP